MIVDTVQLRGLHLGDPAENETPIELVALYCTGHEIRTHYMSDGSARIKEVPCSPIWVPRQCPVVPGDQLWTHGYYVMWSSRDRSATDVRYMQADRGWQTDGSPVTERRDADAIGRA